MDLYRVEPQGIHRLDTQLAAHTAPIALDPKSFFVAVCLHEETKSLADLIVPLGHTAPLDEHIRDASALHHPSYFESARDYDMVVFRGLTADAASLAPKPSALRTPISIDTVPTTLFVYDNLLVVARAKDYVALDRALAKYLGAAPNGQRHPQSSEELALKVLNELVDNFLALRQPLAAQLTHWQQELINPRKPFRNWYTLLEMRDQFRRLEEFCEEQLDAMQEWGDSRLDHLSTHHSDQHYDARQRELIQVRMNDLEEHITRVLNHARRLEASAESTVQMHFAATSYRTSEIMRVLTVITAIFMPLTLITGIFGMNFETMPLLKDHMGFWWTLIAMGVVAVCFWGFFRARRFIESRDTDPRKFR
jgi:magnesium transporter